MARMIPGRSACVGRMTAGEKRLSQRLLDKLEDDYLIWYDVPLGPKQRQPDFVILHPRRGLLVLEVKDWKLETLHALDATSATLRLDRGQTIVVNPLRQARNYAMELVGLLERDPALRHPDGHPHGGKLAMPWGHGVVLTSITRRDFDSNELGHVLPEHLVICQDEMTESADPEAFQQRLWTMFAYPFGTTLSLPQVDRIRWHLFPEVRVRAPLQVALFDPAPQPGTVVDFPDLVQVMDLQQEQLARSLGDGHRVIHGVAGSGKTMILGYRCLQLARSLAKPILVLCFNRTLAARLDQVIGAEHVDVAVNVRTFHGWCSQMLTTFHVARPVRSGDVAADLAAQVEAVMRAVDSGLIPRAQYGAVLIDEGHDFEPDWLRLVVQMLDPQNNSLLLLYDDAQSIYAKSERRRFSFASVGIEARGRTTILKLNYRNSWEVMAVAKAFAASLFEGSDGDEDAPDAIAPESAGRRGPPPQLLRCASRADEAETIAAHVAQLRDDGCSLDQIAVIYREWPHVQAIQRALARRDIAVASARDSRGKDALFLGQPSVKLVSMHSSKGLEFDQVCIPALDRLPGKNADAAIEAKLLYVAMTRAMQGLTMTAVGDAGFATSMRAAMDAVAIDRFDHDGPAAASA